MLDSFAMASKKREGEEQLSFPWAELPSEVQRSVLGWLPLRPLFRFKSVCKLWNSNISSPSFTHFPSLLHCPSNPPWLIFFAPKSFDFLLAFDFDELSWFKLDVGFLSSMLTPNHAHTSSSPPSAQHGFVWCTGTASGRLLLHCGSSLHVCNPLTKALVKLPPFKCIEVPVTLGFSIANTRVLLTPAKTSASLSLHHRLGCNVTPGTSSTGPDRNVVHGLLIPMHLINNVTEQQTIASDIKDMDATTQGCSSSHGYTVVVVGKAKRELVIEAYCPMKNSWEIVGYMPASLIIRHDQMIACNGLFYGLLLNPIGMLVIGESGDGGTLNWRIQAMPVGYWRETRRLLACQNSIFMVCLVDLDDNGCVIWRYDADSKSWIKLHDMPDYISQDMKSISNSDWVDCVGVGNCICFRVLGTLKVLTYNLCNEIWSWLPEPSDAYETILARGLQFEPRLDFTQSL